MKTMDIVLVVALLAAVWFLFLRKQAANAPGSSAGSTWSGGGLFWNSTGTGFIDSSGAGVPFGPEAPPAAI